RRHTRCLSDWSSDVCSSDLTVHAAFTNAPTALLTVVFAVVLAGLTGMLLMQWLVRLGLLVVLVGAAPIALACHATPFTDPAAKQIGRASCRERGMRRDVAGD